MTIRSDRARILAAILGAAVLAVVAPIVQGTSIGQESPPVSDCSPPQGADSPAVGTDSPPVGSESPPCVPNCTISGSGTIMGTSRDDVICGSPDADRIIAGSGDDVIVGLGGDDRITGGSGGRVEPLNPPYCRADALRVDPAGASTTQG